MKTPSKPTLAVVLALAAVCGTVLVVTDSFASLSSARQSNAMSSPHQSEASNADSSSSTRHLQSRTYCGCTDCTTAIFETQAPAGAGADYTCGKRMKFLQRSGVSNIDACRQVAEEFADICGVCNPDICAMGSGNTVAPTASATTGRTAPTPTYTAPTTTGSSTLMFMGQSGMPSSAYPLGKCQGDCDDDSDCAYGLICYQHNAGETVPGCSGDGVNSDVDYCIDPSDIGIVAAPSQTPAPTEARSEPSPTTSSSGDAFKMKIYWQQGYEWQGETFERKWCIKCLDGATCRDGRRVQITNCDSNGMTEWTLSYLTSTIFQVKNINSDNCLTIAEDTQQPVETDVCDATNVRQQFIAQNGAAAWGDKFELNSVWIPQGCIGTTHHPRDRETLYIYSCVISRRWTTSQWNFY